MQYARQRVKDRNRIIKEIQEALAQSKERNDQTPVVSPESFALEQELAEKLEQQIAYKTRGCHICTKCKWHEYGGKSLTFFSLEKNKSNHKTMNSSRLSDGTVLMVSIKY